MSEAGLSPLDVDDVVLTIRAFPMRVAGNSGPLKNEINWETVTEESGNPFPLCEYTSVTRRIRRVGRFDPEIVKRSIQANHPTRIVLNHLDYVDVYHDLSTGYGKMIREFVFHVESSVFRRIDLLGFAPGILLESRRSGLKTVCKRSL